MEPADSKHSERDRRDGEFLLLLSRHELQLAACVHSIVPVWQDAEDVLQATRVTLWRRFDDFQPETDFLAWSRTVARNEARSHARQSGRRQRVFGEELSEALLGQLARPRDVENRRWEAYLHCSQKLGSEARDMLRRCYVNRQTIKDVATELGRSLAGTYKALTRIRRGLIECVRERLGEERV